MKRKIIIILFLFLTILPTNIFAISDTYFDEVKEIIGVETEDDKINLYLFYGKECPHCEEERKWLKTIKENYKDYLNIYYFEVWHNEDNKEIMNKVKNQFNIREEGVPLTIIGNDYYVGYSESIGSMIENKIKEYIELDNDQNEVKIPLLGNINIKNISLPLVAIILGFIDGFNPCAMWILLFLINMLFGLKDKKKQWILGLTFLIVSGFVYFLSMLGINFLLGVATINWLKIAIAIFIIIAGIINFRKYFKIRNEEAGCSVIDNKKRKKLMSRMRKIMASNSFILSLLGIILLAVSVNLIELACSLGFPLIFAEMLEINDINGFLKILYLIIYIIFYMVDDILVFGLSMITLEATGITNKYNKLCTIISAIIMIIMGLLLIFKPDWLMLNF